MRILTRALLLAFALGGFATTAQAGEGCDYSGNTTKNDFETPPPSSSATKPKTSGT